MVDDPLGELLANSYKKMADEHAELLEALKMLVAWKKPIELIAPELGGTLRSIYHAETIIAKVERPVSDR